MDVNMTYKELPVQMFGQETWVSTKFYDSADQKMVKNIIKEMVINSAKGKKYYPVDEPTTVIYGYKKQVGESHIDWFDNPDPDIIVFRTTLKVVEEELG